MADALIDHLNATEALHIATIEDPIEYPLLEKRSVITQRTIPGDVLNFEDGIKSLLVITTNWFSGSEEPQSPLLASLNCTST